MSWGKATLSPVDSLGGLAPAIAVMSFDGNSVFETWLGVWASWLRSPRLREHTILNGSTGLCHFSVFRRQYLWTGGLTGLSSSPRLPCLNQSSHCDSKLASPESVTQRTVK
ncbi:hypothetical protein DPEC_G00067920 [Dallia pectoralis]|uniref:Uncharacterized protein n=1 Tax=Dallia pectoralis TaxID=75939 RepID=A0ACC2H1Z0_DALPE|nr:hypothetical protein DPEC_G00067920 [Dallia pectoralis]